MTSRTPAAPGPMDRRALLGCCALSGMVSRAPAIRAQRDPEPADRPRPLTRRRILVLTGAGWLESAVVPARGGRHLRFEATGARSGGFSGVIGGVLRSLRKRVTAVFSRDAVGRFLFEPASACRGAVSSSRGGTAYRAGAGGSRGRAVGGHPGACFCCVNCSSRGHAAWPAPLVAAGCVRAAKPVGFGFSRLLSAW